MSTNSDVAPLRAVSLGKSYPGVRALDAVDIHVDRGEIVGLVGKNGAGKSTLIRAFSGAISPDSGSVLVEGQPVAHLGPKAAREHGIAFMHQEANLVPGMTVAENLALGAGYPHRGPFVNWSALRRHSKSLLSRVQLADLDPKTRASALSPAEQRQVMFAAALWNSPKVFILDEPTASLTNHEISRLHEIIRGLRNEGVGIVYVSHRLDEILDLADRIVVMRAGAVVAEATRGEVGKGGLVELITGAVDIEREAVRRRSIPPDAKEALRASGIRRSGTDLDREISVRFGEIVGFAGLAGSGRSSLMRCLYGSQQLEAGTVWVGGYELSSPSPRRSIDHGMAMLSEDRRHDGILAPFSVTKNITLPVLEQCRRFGAVPSPSRQRERSLATDFIDKLAIETPGGDAPIGGLSGGNQQKVLMARTIAMKSRMILLDEPTVGIDVGAKAELYALVRELADAGAAILIACSDFEELAAICDRLYVLVEGRIVGELVDDAVTEERIVQMCFEPDAAVAAGAA